MSVEEADQFEVSFGTEIELENLTTRSVGLQDLVNVIRLAELQDALPHVVLLLELAITVPLTSVHCEQVFSRTIGCWPNLLYTFKKDVPLHII